MTDLNARLHDAEARLLEELRRQRRNLRDARKSPDGGTLGQRIADTVAATIGSWPFIIVQSILMAGWVTLNVIAWIQHWDPYPFILLNLLLSFQAAYTAPIIMMSQNRQSDIDRGRALADYQVNLRAEAEIALLHEKLDLLREQQLAEMTAMLQRALARIETLEERRA